jgi:hypothetical protein
MDVRLVVYDAPRESRGVRLGAKVVDLFNQSVFTTLVR